MLKLEKVSKFKKQQIAKKVKTVFQNDNQNDSSTKYPTYEQIFDPEFIHEHFLEEQGSQCFIKLHQINYSSRQFEDSIQTMFLYNKIVLTRCTLMSLAIVSILLSIFSKALHQIQAEILVLHSLITFGMVGMVIVKYFLSEQLKRKQLLRQKEQNKWIKLVKQSILQMSIILMHPNLLTKNAVVLVTEPIHGLSIPLHLNAVFQILMQLRIYLLLLSIINSSIYCNTRANRLCRIYSTKNDLFFGIKALFQYKPLTFLVVLYFSLVISLGQMISLSEGPYQEDFLNLENSLWFIVITMGTVGYGDYSPQTYLGRVISFTAAISGIIISSLLILTLSRYLSMSNGQNKSYVTIKRLELRKMLQKYSKQTINFTTSMMFQSKLKESNNNSEQNKKVMEQLKRKTQKVKFAIRRIKNMVDTDNLKQEINRLFQALSESLNLIYKYQQEYSELLIELYKKEKETINEIQFSFTTEIQNIIKDK